MSVFENEGNGITSTYVENTLANLWYPLHHQDHLHIRGEYCVPLPGTSISKGSPPHTWRIPSNGMKGNGGDRITSTYVENTCVAGELMEIA